MSDALPGQNEAETVDKLCDQFEDALRKGERPPLDEWLTRTDPSALVELAVLDFHYRLQAGECVAAADYFVRYPALRDDREAAIRLVAIEYRAALARDPSLTEEVFRRRYPDLAIAQEWSNGPWVGAAGVAGGGTVAHTPTAGGYGVAFDPTPPPPEPTDDLRGLLAPPDRPGDLGRFGQYHVLGLLGSGGMGMVLRAEDARLRRPVALKLMLPKLAHQQHARKRFLREARAAAMVDHPRIVPIRHVGEVGEVPFIDMPLLQGQSLGTRLRTGLPLTPAEVVRFAREAAEGLAAAHATGLTHRDVKPDNIWLEDREGEVHIKLLDFGLARGGEIEQLSHSGMVAGTPAYMSPEQANGLAVDHRSDLFSLGVVVYEMASGRRPYLSDTPPLAELAPTMPPALSALVVRMLAGDLQRRPESAGEVAAELRRIESGEGARTTVTSTLPAVGDRSPPDRGRRRPTVTIGCSVAISLCLLIGVTIGGTVAWKQFQYTASGPSKEPIDSPAVMAEVRPPVEPVRVKWIAVNHYAKIGEGLGEAKGILGKTSFGAVLGDQVTIEVELTRPAYAYLVVFRPDGVIEPIFPEDKAEPPHLTDRPRYPLVFREVNYGLTDGTGLWVFAVAVSDHPLPPYAEVFAGKSAGWVKTDSPARIVWWDDGKWVEGLSPTGVVGGDRGAGATVPGKSAVVKAMEWLKAGAKADTAAAIGFRVDERN